MNRTLLLLLALPWTADEAVPRDEARALSSAAGRVVHEIDPRVWCLHQARNGDLWLGSDGGGVYRYDGRTVTRFDRTDGLGGDQVRDIESDARGDVLVSTTAGVARFDGRRWTALPIEEPRDGDGWRLDPEDVWIVVDPGRGGPCRYDGETLYRLRLSKSPAEDAFRTRHPDSTVDPSGVTCIHEDRAGHLWFGTSDVGLCRYDGRGLGWMYEEALTTTPAGGAFGIRAIHQDRSGDYWIGNTRQRFEIVGDTRVQDGFTLLRSRPRAGVPDAVSDTDEGLAYFSSMAEDDAGTLWMACGADGVWKYDGERVARFSLPGEAHALSLLVDREGRLWVGTLRSGAFVRDGDGFEPFAPPKKNE